jgi:endogenous inhibitor of DNA gyrase (YacG/DUF329 family)
MAIRPCPYCGTPVHVAESSEQLICPGCTARLAAESALTHALVGVHAIASELERALADVWRGLPPSAPPRRRRSDRP